MWVFAYDKIDILDEFLAIMITLKKIGVKTRGKMYNLESEKPLPMQRR